MISVGIITSLWQSNDCCFPPFLFLKEDFYDLVLNSPLSVWLVEVGRIDKLCFRRCLHEKIVSSPDKGNAYHSEVLDFELNGWAKWNFVLFHLNRGKMYFMCRRKSEHGYLGDLGWTVAETVSCLSVCTLPSSFNNRIT